MAVGNRTETKSAVTSALVPVLQLSDHITLLNDSINESVLFRKDVIASETPVGAAVTVDFANKDTATVTITVGTTVTFTGLENGDVKYLVITKAATNSVAFAGATNETSYQLLIDNTLTVVKYVVYNKNGDIHVLAINKNIIVAISVAEIQSENRYSFPTSEQVGQLVNPLYEMHKDVTIPAWNMDTLATLNISTPSELVTNFDRIKGITCTIYNDGRTSTYAISYQPSGSSLQGGSVTINGVNIVLERLSSGFFNSASFSSVAQNRGYLRIFYSTS